MKDEGGRMNPDVRVPAFILHPSEFILIHSWLSPLNVQTAVGGTTSMRALPVAR
jgi:hypothetical protein